MAKTILLREVMIDAPKKKVWEALADFGNVYKMSQGVKKSYLTSDKKEGVGTTRHCDLAAMGAQVEERISEWKKEESMKIDIYKSKNLPMMINMSGFFILKAEGQKTLLKGGFEYKMSNFIGDLMNALFMRRMNKKGWEGFLAGLKYYVETGMVVKKDTKLNIASVKRYQR